jgi:predicted transcriptional regulator
MAKPSTELTSTLGDIDDEAEAQALAEAEADVAAGRLVPHGKVVRWLRSWGTTRELPCPRWRK